MPGMLMATAPTLPHHANTPQLDTALNAIKNTVQDAGAGLLDTYGSWLALAAPFVICLLLLEWVLSYIAGRWGRTAGMLDFQEQLGTEYHRSQGHTVSGGWFR